MSMQDALNAMNESQIALDELVSDAVSPIGQPWTDTLVKYLSISVLAFAVIVLVLCTILLWRSNASASEVLKVFGIISIIGLSALLLITGFSNEQLTPIVGLFGAIAGYLLGKEAKP
ncbi:hypothetical protein [Nitrosomonas communis]|uniref:Uncharacterized protein n=1 Tax=Nitrosomonas communis TaxID=44574 RepID=A0A1H2V642_9PROT|nr:hypothetical protein [Nitrosomonas communis]SDW63394.1 hypothetical protein SAMN05421882_101960 [Nitrosomonas communis]